ncbi:hypothetical protein [endosymbiont DhMRE of Dentiscutata heterogama]|uniref:hypothetical protein n=1 Tax=endosymbiont DhMRE of Dentiscutata heterogama TaxID=1609546 RepID=UPI002AD4C033|nr:hypothetical protein [endosymbiont DhMRE of Dentiscutata heterogama]
MASNVKKKRVSRQYQVFFWACLASLLGLLVYILGAKKIHFPNQWMPKGGEGKDPVKSFLFFSGISVHLQVNFVISMFYMFLNPDKMDQVKLQKWKLWINRTLVFIFSLGAGFLKYWDNVSGSLGHIFLLCLIITVINCCLLELLIQLMNQYGICNAFYLILFTEFLPYEWISNHWNELEPMLYLILITIAFIWITNLKWESPVETNTLYSQHGKLLKKRKSKLGFRFSIGFMPLIQLSQFVGFIYNIVLMRRAGVNWGSFKNIQNEWGEANKTRAGSMNSLGANLNNPPAGGKFWGPFFLLCDTRYLFDIENLKDWFLNKKWWIVGALFFLLFLRYLAVWIQMRKVGIWKTKEMSKDLRSRGIYINYLAPGHMTRNLLRKIINKIIFFWYFIILIFNIIFDNLFKSSGTLPFFNWFGSVNIGVDLVRQIRTKYKYIKTNK